MEEDLQQVCLSSNVREFNQSKVQESFLSQPFGMS